MKQGKGYENSSSSTGKTDEGTPKSGNLEEVREYSLALYKHLQEQLKTRQLTIPRPRNKRKRVTRQTILPTEENVTEGGLKNLDIEEMLMQGENFIPPVDPKMLRSAIQRLLQLVNAQKKKGNSYPKRSGYTYAPPVQDGNILKDEDLSKELVTPVSQRQRISENIDASISLDDLGNENGAVDIFINIPLSPSTQPTSAKQVAQEILTTIDVSEDFLPQTQTINTLGRGSRTYRPSGRRQPFWERRRRYRGHRHNCPDPETTTLNNQGLLALPTSSVQPTLPSRPTIPELDFSDTPSTTLSTTTLETVSSPRIPGAIPTPATSPSLLVPSSTTTIPSPSYDINYDDYNYDDSSTDYVNKDMQDYDYSGVDPRLISGRTVSAETSTIIPRNVVKEGNRSPLNGEVKLNEDKVIILVEPENERVLNGQSSTKDSVSGSAIILIDPNDARKLKQHFNQEILSLLDQERVEGSAVILIDSDNNKSLKERWKTIEFSTARENVTNNSVIILVDPDQRGESPLNNSRRLSELYPALGTTRRGSTVMLVDPKRSSEFNVNQRQKSRESFGSKEFEEGLETIILVDPASQRKTAARKRPQPLTRPPVVRKEEASSIILVDSRDSPFRTTGYTRPKQSISENDASVIILVDPSDSSSQPLSQSINTLNPTLRPPANFLIPPAATDISQVISSINTQSAPVTTVRSDSRFVQARTRRLREQNKAASKERSHDVSSHSQNQSGRRRRYPRRRGNLRRHRDNVSGRNDFLLWLGRGRGSSRKRNDQYFSTTASRALGAISHNRRPLLNGEETPRKSITNLRDDREFLNRERTRSSTFHPFSSGSREYPTGKREISTENRDFLAESREFLGRSRNSHSVVDDFFETKQEREDFSPRSRELTVRDQPSYDGGNWESRGRFSWANPSSAEVRIFRTEESIPEKIRELQESIEAKARAWAEYGFQRTRPEFRKTRRPSIG